MFKKLFLVLFFTLFASVLYAETNSTTIDTNSTQSASSLSAAYKLLEEMNLKQVYENAVNSSTQRLVAANSSFKSIENKIKDFYNKYIGWDAIKEDLAKLYSKYYTKEELNDIANFYKTKTGKKVLKTMAKLSYEGQLLTQRKIRPHLNELKKLLDDAIKKAQESEEKKETSKKEEKK